MKILLLVLLTFSIKSFACEFDNPKTFSLFTSLETESTHAFDENKTLYDIPFFRAFNCKKLALKNQYLMIGQGPEVTEFDDQVTSFSFSDEFYPSQCKIENSPFKVLDFDTKLKTFKERKKYLNNCLEIYIEDEGRMPLRIKENQVGCKVTKLTTHKALVQGGFCFVKPSVTSSYIVKVKVKKECQTKSGLSSIAPGALDVKGIFNFYSSGDDSGTSSSLVALQSTTMRILTNSDEKIITSNDSYGGINPQFPANFVNPNVHAGEFTMQDYGPNYKIETPILVDNRCKKVCDGKICYGPCEYAQPVAYEVRLYDISKRKTEILTSWYDGGVAQPGYQGFIRGNGFEIPKIYLESGKKYRLKYSFNDPKYDFEKLKDRIIRKFGQIQQRIPQMNRNGINDIPEINEIVRISELPNIREIYGINFVSGLEDLKDTLALLRSYLSYKLWPPYYEKTCNPNLTKCVSSSIKNLEIDIDFKFVLDEQQMPKIKIIKMKRTPLFGKQTETSSLPVLKCGYDI